jgi:hypothetical protein
MSFRLPARLLLLAFFLAPLGLHAVGVRSVLLQQNDERVKEMLAVDPGLASLFLGYREAGVQLMLQACAYAQPESRFHRDPRLIPAMTQAAAFLQTAQHPSGLFDVGNFESPPDTAFILDTLCSAQGYLLSAGRSETRPLEDQLRKLILAAADGVVQGGVHTPNHRWHVAATLLHVQQLYPDPRYVARAEEWLAEGVDQDPDGEFSERSPAYNSRVNNPALLHLALRLARPELLDHLRRNLRLALAYVEPDGTVETLASRRQDQHPEAKIELWEYYVPLRYLAVVDQDPLFAAAAEWIERAFVDRLFSRPIDPNLPLPFLIELAELSAPLPAAAPWPDDFVRVVPHSGLARVRRGPWSATIYGGSDHATGLGYGSGLAMNPTFFKLRNGQAVLESVRLTPAFFSTGFFYGSGLTQTSDGFQLEQTVRVPYHLPLEPAARRTDGDYALTGEGRFFSKMDFPSRPKDYRTLTTRVTLRETKGQFHLEFNVDGQPSVPVTIELVFRSGGVLHGVRPEGADGRGREPFWLIDDGFARYQFGGDSIEFGPGTFSRPPNRMESEAVLWIGGRMSVAGERVYLTGMTPFRHTLIFR